MSDHAKGERVAIFIDGSNFYHSVKDSFNVHVGSDIGFEEFKKLVEFLRKDRILVGTYYYNAPLDRSYDQKIYSKQQRFFADLKKIPGFHVILCRMRKMRDSSGGYKYSVKGDDINIAVDMVRMAYENAYETAILVSGDGDFVPAITTVQKIGKKVENAYFHSTRSSYLKQVCNLSISLDKVIDEYLRENGPALLKDEP